MTTTIGSRLRYTRQTRGLSIGEVAKKTGLSKGAISLAERGKTSMSWGNLARICQVLNVGSDFIVLGRTCGSDAEWDETASGEDGLSLRALVLKLHKFNLLAEVYKSIGAFDKEQLGTVLDVLKAMARTTHTSNYR